MADKMIALADLAGMEHDNVVEELCAMFAKTDALKDASVVIAYVSEGNWGCDSSALVVFERQGKLYEVNGSHCSCYGFEGQWDPEEVGNVEAICQRSDWGLASGGYDDDRESNASSIRAHLRNLYGEAA